MDAKKWSAVGIITAVTGGVGFVASNPLALGFVTSFAANHPVFAALLGLFGALGLLAHPQPHN